MNKKQNKGGRNPKIDPAVYRYYVRFNSKEHERFLRMFERSGMAHPSVFIKAQFFGETFHVVTFDKGLHEYYTKLSDFHAQFRRVAHELALRYVSVDGDVPLLGECKAFPLVSLSRQFFRQLTLALDTGKRIDHVPGILSHPFRDSGMCGDVTPVIVDGSIRHRVLDGDLPRSGGCLDRAHHVVTSGGERPVFGIRAVAVLAACPFPRVQAIVEPAAITEVLLKVIDGNDTHLTREAVIDFLQDVILGFLDQLFNVVCIHSRLFRHGGIECHFTEVVSIFVHLLGAYPELDLLHRNNSWFALEIEH